MSQAQKWVWIQNGDILNFQYKWLIGMDASRSVDELSAVHLHMHSAFPTKMMEQTIGTS